MTTRDEQQKQADVLSELLGHAGVQRALDWIGANLERFVNELTTISEIPAPTFAEERRAAHVADRFRALGLDDVEIDGAGNVVARVSAQSSEGGVAFVAHLDTVFPNGTDVCVTRRDGRLHGPGIGDNSAGLAGMLAMLEAMREAGLEPARPLWLVASTGEEGLGDLKGARAALDQLQGRIDTVIAIEGALLGRVTHEAVGSLRWQVRLRGPGGHSWHDFGRPSAIDAAALAVAGIYRLDVPTDPRTTFNVGRIEGGIGVNVIASEASFLLDMRSLDPATLASLVERAEQVIRQSAQGEGVDVDLETVGDRPAGSIPREHDLVQTASAVLRQLGIDPRYEAASTDANVPLSRGIPAVTVGVTHGGGIHTKEEWIDIAPCVAGIRQLLLLALSLASVASPS